MLDTSNVTVNSNGGVLVGGVLNRSNVVGYDPHCTLAQAYNWTLSVQQQLTRQLVLELNYSASSAHHLPVLLDADINRFAGDLILNKGQLGRLNPNFGTIGYGTTDANSSGNVGTAMLTQRMSHRFTVCGIYSWAKALDPFSTSGSLADGAATTSTPVIQAFDLKAQRGRADYDSALLRNTIGGWQMSGVWNIHTGLPVTVYTSAAFSPVYDAQGMLSATLAAITTQTATPTTCQTSLPRQSPHRSAQGRLSSRYLHRQPISTSRARHRGQPGPQHL